MKRVFIIHGWDGTPEDCWFPWLKEELEKKDFEVMVPQLPEANNPRIYNWLPKVKEVVGSVDKDTYFVGHSMGCQTIARFLEGLPEGVKAGGAVFVAGFFKKLTGLEEASELDVEKHWLGTPLDLEKVKNHLPRSIAIFSNDDPFVPLDNLDAFRDKLKSEIVIVKNMGHFNTDAGVKESPIILEKFLEVTNQHS